MLQQRTLKSLTRAVGVGLHSGQRVELTLRPAQPDTGIVFRRVDLPQPVDIPVHAHSVCDTRMATALSPGGDPGAPKVNTVEHLLSAFADHVVSFIPRGLSVAALVEAGAHPHSGRGSLYLGERLIISSRWVEASYDIDGEPLTVVLSALLSVATIAVAVQAWRRGGDLAPRYVVLVLATLLVNPHMYSYDLLLLMPAHKLMRSLDQSQES